MVGNGGKTWCDTSSLLSSINVCRRQKPSRFDTCLQPSIDRISDPAGGEVVGVCGCVVCLKDLLDTIE